MVRGLCCDRPSHPPGSGESVVHCRASHTTTLSLSLNASLFCFEAPFLEEGGIASARKQARGTSRATIYSTTRPLMPLRHLCKQMYHFVERCWACPRAPPTFARVLCHKRWRAQMARAIACMHCRDPETSRAPSHVLADVAPAEKKQRAKQDNRSGKKAAFAAIAAVLQNCVRSRGQSSQHDHTRSPIWPVAATRNVQTTRLCCHLRASAWGSIDGSGSVQPSPQPPALKR